MSTVTHLKFKDEDGEDGNELESIKVDIKGRGYLATFIFRDGQEVEEVYLDKNLLMKDIEDNL